MAPLPNIDMILGLPWLQQANPIVDWSTNTVTFKEMPATLEGHPKNTRMEAHRNGTDARAATTTEGSGLKDRQLIKATKTQRKRQLRRERRQ